MGGQGGEHLSKGQEASKVKVLEGLGWIPTGRLQKVSHAVNTACFCCLYAFAACIWVG